MMSSRSRSVAFIAVLALAASVAAAQTTEVNVRVYSVPSAAIYSARAIPAHIIVPQARSFVADRGSPKVEITQITVGAVIAEQTATTTMEIDLRNPSPMRIEAELVVPLPDGAAVRSFTFSGTAKEPTAELLPKDAALGTYKSIVARMKDPAILEFAGYNLIRSSIFPIEASGTQKVRLTYEHLLAADGQRVDYVLPRTESIDYRVPWDVSLKIKSKRAISTVFSSSHKIDVRRGEKSVAQVHVGKEAMNEPGSLQISYLQGEGDGVAASLFACPDPKSDGGYFLLLAGLPATKPVDEKPVLREVTLVIDRSGSMTGEKLKQVKAAALQIVDGLEEGEAFNIIDYSDYLDNFASKPVLKSKQTAEDARHYIRRLTAGGGTNIYDALAEALRPAPREGMLPIVLFLTDGVPTVGVRDEATLRAAAVKMNKYKRRVFTFGVGYDVNAPLLTHLAQNSRAASTFVLPNEDIEVKVSQVYRRLSGPVIAEPELKVLDDAKGDGPASGHRVFDLLPGVQPDLFEGDQLVVLGRYQGQAPLKFRLDGLFRGRPRHFEFAFQLDHATVKNGFVPRLWASRKIAALTEEIREAGAGSQPSVLSARSTTDPRMKELVDEIVRLSLEFGILTEYTAFLDKEGTDLTVRNEVLRQATANFVNRAQRTREGIGAVNQMMNSNFQISQSLGNGRNVFLDENMNRVETSRVQQVTNGAVFQRGNTWIDSGAVREGSPNVDDTVRVGTPEFSRLVDQLITENRQSVLAVQGEILLRVNGRNVLIKGNE